MRIYLCIGICNCTLYIHTFSISRDEIKLMHLFFKNISHTYILLLHLTVNGKYTNFYSYYFL